MTPRDTWIDAALAALAGGGLAAVRVEAIARDLNMTKGSFYHHFKGRPALLEAMLERWRQRNTEALIAMADSEAAPHRRLHALLQGIFSPAPHESLEPAVRAWASTDALARRAVDAVDARRLTYVSDLLTDCGLPYDAAKQRAKLLYRVVIGDFTWRGAGGEPMTTQDRDLLARLILAQLD